MTTTLRDEVEAVLGELLVREHFDYSCPVPAVAWRAFKSFACVPLVELTTTTLGVEVSQYGDRDDVLWLSFLRRVEEPNGTGWSCGCLLSRRTPASLCGIHESLWWWAEHGTVEDWMGSVESMPTFGSCIRLEGWQWEGYSE